MWKGDVTVFGDDLCDRQTCIKKITLNIGYNIVAQ